MTSNTGWSVGLVARNDFLPVKTYQDAVSVARDDCVREGGGQWFQWDLLQQHVLYGEEVGADGSVRVLGEDELAAREEEGGPG